MELNEGEEDMTSTDKKVVFCNELDGHAGIASGLKQKKKAAHP